MVLDWVFIFPCGMGIFGAVFATGLAPLISICILSPHFLQRKNQFKPVACRPQGQRTARILSSGVPSLVTEVSSGIVIIVFNSLILGMEGNTGVAAYGVIANLSLVVISIYTGIAQGIQPFSAAVMALGTGTGSPPPFGTRWIAMAGGLRGNLRGCACLCPSDCGCVQPARAAPPCRPLLSKGCGCTSSHAPLPGAT